MRSVLAMLLLGGALPLALASSQERSDPPQASEPAGPKENPSAQLQEPAAPLARDPLDTFYMRDKDGNLVPVLGLPFEEFERLLRIRRGFGPPPPPAYVLQSLTLTGEAEEETASFNLTAAIVVRDSGWVRVPLGLQTAALREETRYDGPGKSVVSLDANDGIVCWLEGQSEQPHVIRLRISARIAPSADEQRLALSLPRATESLLRLAVPSSGITASLASGEGILSVERKGEQDELSVLGAAGDLSLTWRQRTGTGLVSQMEVSGEITVNIESQHRITSEARLRIRNTAKEFERVVVSLPPGMDLAPMPPVAGYTLAPASEAGSSDARQIEVRLTTAAATADVVIRAQLRPDGAVRDVLPAQFIVANAARQRGFIEFIAEEELQLRWSDNPNVHRLELSPEHAAAGRVARYEYFRQPCNLHLEVVARPARLSVEPTHLAFVQTQHVRLETLLKCRFRGARPEGLSVNLEGWTLERLMPDTWFDVPILDEDGHAFFPIRPSVTLPPEVELKLEAHRPAAADAPLEFGFPRAVASNVTPATVAIFAADNIELTPQASELVGLAADATPVRVPGQHKAPLVYRDLGGGERARFSATFRTLARLTTVAAHARVRIEGQQLHIEQQLNYRVAHEPQRVFELLAPTEVWTAGSLQVWLDEELLPVTAQPASAATPLSLVRLQVSAPAEQIGSVKLSVRSSMPFRWNRQEPLALAIPLVLPVTEGPDQLTGQQLEFLLSDGMTIEPDLEDVEDMDGPAAISGASNLFNWANPTHASRWILRTSEAGRLAAISVPQMWAQTWFSPRIRQERVAVRINTQRDSVLLRVDKSVKQSSVLIAVDGHTVHHSFRQPGVVVAPIPTAARGRECVLEVCYAVEPEAAPLGFLQKSWRPLQIEDAEPPRRVYWQLAMPANEQLLVGPADMTPEMAWSSRFGLPQRRPVLDQRQLEAWIKASAQDPLPRGANEYLFGMLGQWPTVEVSVVARRTLVVVISGTALLLGLLLLHVPLLRRPEWGVVLGVLVVVTAGWMPETALLIAQSAVMGLMIVLLVAAWRQLGRKPSPLIRMPATSVRRSRESPSTQPPLPRERSSRVTSTAPGQTAILEVRP